MSTRREFLKASTLLGFGATVPAFLGNAARATAPAGEKGAKDLRIALL